MIEIKVPKEVKGYKTKLFFGLNIRQLSCASAALGICVPLYMFGRKYLGDDLTSWLVIIIAAPLVLVGFFTINEMTFEQFAKEWISYFFGIQKRKYEYEPIFFDIRKGYLAEDLAKEKNDRKEELKRLKKQKRKEKIQKLFKFKNRKKEAVSINGFEERQEKNEKREEREETICP